MLDRSRATDNERGRCWLVKRLKARYPIELSQNLVLEPYVGIPFGLTLAVLNDLDGSGDTVWPGFNTGVLAGAMMLFDGHFGGFIEIGWRHHQAFHDENVPFFGDTSFKGVTNQFALHSAAPKLTNQAGFDRRAAALRCGARSKVFGRGHRRDSLAQRGEMRGACAHPPAPPALPWRNAVATAEQGGERHHRSMLRVEPIREVVSPRRRFSGREVADAQVASIRSRQCSRISSTGQPSRSP
jgi:hypothetical protein